LSLAMLEQHLRTKRDSSLTIFRVGAVIFSRWEDALKVPSQSDAGMASSSRKATASVSDPANPRLRAQLNPSLDSMM
jgi:hypothetical protein